MVTITDSSAILKDAVMEGVQDTHVLCIVLKDFLTGHASGKGRG